MNTEKVSANTQQKPCLVEYRALNLLIDTICLYFLCHVSASLVGVIVRIAERIVKVPLIADFQALGYLLTVIVGYFYYIFFEYRYGKTPGKFITGTRVIATNSNKLTIKAVLIRTTIRLLPFEWISFFRRRPLGLHDSISNTIVVMEKGGKEKGVATPGE